MKIEKMEAGTDVAACPSVLEAWRQAALHRGILSDKRSKKICSVAEIVLLYTLYTLDYYRCMPSPKIVEPLSIYPCPTHVNAKLPETPMLNSRNDHLFEEPIVITISPDPGLEI